MLLTRVFSIQFCNDKFQTASEWVCRIDWLSWCFSSFFVFILSSNTTNGNFKDKRWVLYMHLSSKQTMNYRQELKTNVDYWLKLSIVNFSTTALTRKPKNLQEQSHTVAVTLSKTNAMVSQTAERNKWVHTRLLSTPRAV